MKTLKNLSYRIKSLFIGESGIVEKVDTVSEIDEKGRARVRDSIGYLPQLVTFSYKYYKPGDKFP